MKNTQSHRSMPEILENLINSLLSNVGNDIFVIDTSVILHLPLGFEENASDMETAENKAAYYQKITPWICDSKRILTKGGKGEIQKLLLFDRLQNEGKKGFEKYNSEAGNLHRKLSSKEVYRSKDNEKGLYSKINEYGRMHHSNLPYVAGCSGEDKSSIITTLEIAASGIKTGLASRDFKQIILMEEMARYLHLPLDIVSYDSADKIYHRRSICVC